MKLRGSMNNIFRQIVDFLAEIGIEVQIRSIDHETFLPGVTIEAGKLVVDESKLKHPGDMLHEAGHLAVTAHDERPTMTGTIELPDAESGGCEMAAIAWSYAALCHLRLDPSVVFHEEGYKGGSESLIENFSHGCYIGVPMLQWFGLAVEEGSADGADVKPYPHMIKWVR